MKRSLLFNIFVTSSIMLLACSASAQLADVTYTVQTVNTTSYENASSGACWEGGDEEYTSYVGAWDNVNGASTNTGCQTCTNNGNCSYGGGLL